MDAFPGHPLWHHEIFRNAMFENFCPEMKAFVNNVPQHIVDGVPGNLAPLYMQINALRQEFQQKFEMLASQLW